MTVDSAAPDAPDGFTVTIEVPWSGTDAEFRARFQAPLHDLLAGTAIAYSLRSHPRADRHNRPATAGLELRTHDQPLLALVLTHLRHLGAPPETAVEIDTGNATLQTTLDELGSFSAPPRSGDA